MLKQNLTATINLQRMDRSGLCAIRIRRTIKRKVTYIPTGIAVSPAQFKNGEVIKHDLKTQYNALLRQMLADLQKEHIEVDGLKMRPAGNNDFYLYCENKIKQEKPRNSKGTWMHKRSYLNKLKKFRPALNFNEVTPSFMVDFENFCRSDGNKPTTIWSGVKFIKTMINAAIIDDVIPLNPMKGYKAKPYINPTREFLTDVELGRLEAFVTAPNNKTLVKVATWFLFGCYTGLRYADVRGFDMSKVMNGRILLRTEKSLTDVSIKVHPRLQHILQYVDKQVFTNQKMNDYLKVIALKCGINKNITFHTSRHTFAVYFLNKGGSMESLSKILGHSSTKVTAVYGKITNIRIDNEMDLVFGK